MNCPVNSRQWHPSLVLKITLLLICLTAPAFAETISGTIQYPSGAFIAGAQVEITGGDLAQPLVFASDKQGKFTSSDFKPGTYSVRVTHDGFEPLNKTLDLSGPTALRLTLAIAVAKESISVSGRRLDWFFNEWVYGMQVPRYHFEYQTSPAEGGKVKLHMTVTQSEVNASFGMLVPVFANFGNGMGRIGQIGIVGNSARSVDVILPSEPKKVALNAFNEILER